MKKIDLPRFSERIRGITLPVDGVMHAFDYDEVFKIDLSDVSVEVLNEDPYAFADAHAGFLGVSGNEPLLSVGNSMLSTRLETRRPFTSSRRDSPTTWNFERFLAIGSSRH